MRPHSDLVGIQKAWDGVLNQHARLTKLVGMTDDETLVVLCQPGSLIRDELTARTAESLDKLNGLLLKNNKPLVTSIELLQGDPSAVRLRELLHEVATSEEQLRDELLRLRDVSDDGFGTV